MGEEIDGAVQQAAQPGRQVKVIRSRHPAQRGHKAHICKGCFTRPANSPASGPEPA